MSWLLRSPAGWVAGVGWAGTVETGDGEADVVAAVAGVGDGAADGEAALTGVAEGAAD